MTPPSPRNIIGILLGLLIGGVFVFSALSKIPNLEQFGWAVVETTFLNWTAAEWAARLLIGLELFLGLMFIAHLRIRNLAIPLALAVLLLFTIYLLLVISRQGNGGNCGCFGEVIAMTPLQSVWKNLILIALLVLLRGFTLQWEFRFSRIILPLGLTLCLALPFALNPPESIYIYDKEPDSNEPIPLSILYHSPKNRPPAEELRKGKHIITFMSLTCEYCRKAAKRIRIMKDEYPQLPFYAVLNGDSSRLADFFSDTRMTNVPFNLFVGAQEFATMNGGYSFPTIKWVRDTTLVRESNYLTLHEKDILAWLKEP